MRFKVRMCLGILFLLAGSAKGQFLLFTPPGGPQGRPETVEERLEREISQAPHHLGPVRIAPLVGFRNVAYVRDLFGNQTNVQSDVTATAGAGFRAYLHTGSKVTWIAQALPEYVWWNKREDARRLNLSGGLETLVLLNRLTVDMAASRVEEQRIVTPELPELVSSATDMVRLDSELEVTSQFRPFLSARWIRQEGLVDEREDPAVQRIALLDRDEQVLRAGVHWYPRDDWKIGVGVESSQVEFDRPELDSSNEGTSPLLELTIDRPHFFVNADLVARSLTATEEGSRFVDYDGITGSLSLSLVPRKSAEASLYANREVLYSLSESYPYLQDERIGVALGTGLGQRVLVRIFGEVGDDEYTAFLPAAPERTDDLTAYGGTIRFVLTDLLELAFEVTRLDLDSNIPGLDRTYTSGGLTVTLRGNLQGTNL